MIGVGCVTIGAKEEYYLHDVIKSGHITAGPILKRFETEFANRHQCQYGIMVNSGTSALQIGLAALKEMNRWSDGAEVILPALTFIASANMIREVGLTPRFVDVNATSYTIDPALIEDAINPQTVAIMPVHLFGLPCEMSDIMQLAKTFELNVIEDSCEAMGVACDGRQVGSFGDVGCFSTYAAHIISTGVGGLAITNNFGLYQLMRSYANHGRDPDFLGYSDTLDPHKDLSSVIDKRFRFPRFGYSHRATQMEAALGLGQLERLNAIIEKRYQNARILSRLIDRNLVEVPRLFDDREHAFMMFPIVLPTGIDRRSVMLEIERQGVETRPFFDIVNQPCYRDLGHSDMALPVTRRLSAQGFYVGCHQALAQTDLLEIANAVNSAVAKERNQVSV